MKETVWMKNTHAHRVEAWATDGPLAMHGRAGQDTCVIRRVAKYSTREGRVGALVAGRDT